MPSLGSSGRGRGGGGGSRIPSEIKQRIERPRFVPTEFKTGLLLDQPNAVSGPIEVPPHVRLLTVCIPGNPAVSWYGGKAVFQTGGSTADGPWRGGQPISPGQTTLEYHVRPGQHVRFAVLKACPPECSFLLKFEGQFK